MGEENPPPSPSVMRHLHPYGMIVRLRGNGS